MDIVEEKKYNDISDVWMPDPPIFCDKRRFILDGQRYMDIVICEFFCKKSCSTYYDYNIKLKQEKKERKKLLDQNNNTEGNIEDNNDSS